jgi:hypothetical protein
MTRAMSPEVPGRRIVQASWAGTILFTITAVVATIAMGSTQYVAVAVSFGLFTIGCVAFLWAYALAVQRSRDVEIGIGGLYFLAGPTAPPRVRWLLDGSLAVQVLVGFATASARPFTTLAFGVLVPMFGVGCNGLWGARHGSFGPRIIEPVPVGAEKMSGEAAPIDQNEDHG